MARRPRFKPDPNFEQEVVLAVSGLGVRGRSSVRRRQTTLDFVADQVIEEAIAIANHQRVERGLSQYDADGKRDSDFRRSEKGRKYTQSFKKLIVRENGKLVFYVINTHPRAATVEFGNGDGGRRGPSRSPRGYYKIPITMKTYRKIRARLKAQRTKPTLREYNLQAAQQRKRYWEKVKRQGTDYALLDRRTSAGKKVDRSSVGSSLRKANTKISEAERDMAQYDAPVDEPNTFVGIWQPEDGGDGRAYLYTKNPRTYVGYGILATATRRIALRYLRE